MKKLIILLCLVTLVIGCTKVEASKYAKVDIGTYGTHIEKFVFEGHSYISFSQINPKTTTTTILHDPDCKCHLRRYQR